MTEIQHQARMVSQQLNRLQSKGLGASGALLQARLLAAHPAYRDVIKINENTGRITITTKKQYQSAQEQLAVVEKNLNEVLSDYSTIEFQSKNRIRQIYKKQRKGLFQLLLSTTEDIWAINISCYHSLPGL
jgi:hypothetical protein